MSLAAHAVEALKTACLLGAAATRFILCLSPDCSTALESNPNLRAAPMFDHAMPAPSHTLCVQPDEVIEPSPDSEFKSGCIHLFSHSHSHAHRRFLRLTKPAAGSSFRVRAKSMLCCAAVLCCAVLCAVCPSCCCTCELHNCCCLAAHGSFSRMLACCFGHIGLGNAAGACPEWAHSLPERCCRARQGSLVQAAQPDFTATAQPV